MPDRASLAPMPEVRTEIESPGSASQGIPAEWFTPRRYAALLGLLIFLTYPEVILGSKTFVFRDFGLFGYPLACFHKESVWKGEMPLWNPYSNCGLPFLAQWNTVALYPLSIIYLLLPLSWSLGMFNLIHQFLAGLGMYFLARRWTKHGTAASVAGIGFAFGGFTTNCLVWPNYMASLAWMPWTVLWVQRGWREGGRTLLIASLIGALQMLSGTPEIILFTWLLLGMLALADAVGLGMDATSPLRLALRKILGRASAVAALVCLLSAAQLLPFLQLLGHSQRDAAFAPDSWPMPLTGWANLLVPLFGCVKSSAGVFFQHEQSVTSSYYTGILLLALAMLAAWNWPGRQGRLLGLLGLACLIMALGKNTPLYGWARTVFPPLGFIRFPVKWVIPVVFLAPLLASVGWAWLSSASETERRVWWKAARGLASGLCAIVAVVVAYSWLRPAQGEVPTTTLLNGASRAIVLVLGLFLIAQWLRGNDVSYLARIRTVNRASFAVPASAGSEHEGPPEGGTAYDPRFMARSERQTQLLALACMLLVWVDLTTHAPRQNPTVDRSVYAAGLPPLEELKPLPEVGASRAMLSLHAILELRTKILTNVFAGYLCNRLGLYDNCNLVDGIPKVDGFFALYLRHEQDVRFWLYPSTNSHRTNLADFLGVSQMTADHSVFEFVPRPRPMPLVSGGQQPVFLTSSNILAAMLRLDWDPRNVVFLPDEVRDRVTVTNQSQVVFPSPARITAHAWETEVEVKSPGPAMVVFAQPDYPAWHATVNGQPTQIWRANHAYQAITVPPGRNQVRLQYRDRWFWIGVVLSLGALAACIAGLVRSRTP